MKPSAKFEPSKEDQRVPKTTQPQHGQPHDMPQLSFLQAVKLESFSPGLTMIQIKNLRQIQQLRFSRPIINMRQTKLYIFCYIIVPYEIFIKQ